MKKIFSWLKNNKYKSFAAIFVVIFIIYYYAIKFFYSEMTERGQFGDMFGGINAFFSGLAFLGVIYAIILQREELSLQRKELELTRKELERSARAQEKSEEALFRQAESLKATAKLNGLSSILQYYGMLMEVIGIGRYGNSGVSQEYKGKAEIIKQQIEDIIKDK